MLLHALLNWVAAYDDVIIIRCFRFSLISCTHTYPHTHESEETEQRCDTMHYTGWPSPIQRVQRTEQTRDVKREKPLNMWYHDFMRGKNKRASAWRPWPSRRAASRYICSLLWLSFLCSNEYCWCRHVWIWEFELALPWVFTRVCVRVYLTYKNGNWDEEFFWIIIFFMYIYKSVYLAPACERHWLFTISNQNIYIIHIKILLLMIFEYFDFSPYLGIIRMRSLNEAHDKKKKKYFETWILRH